MLCMLELRTDEVSLWSVKRRKQDGVTNMRDYVVLFVLAWRVITQRWPLKLHKF